MLLLLYFLYLLFHLVIKMALNYPKYISSSDVEGITNGVNPQSGIIGENISSGVQGPTSIAHANITSLTQVDLQPGLYLLRANGCAIGTAALSSFELGIGQTVNSFAGVTLGRNKVQTNAAGAVFSGAFTYRVNISVPTTYYLTFNVGFASGTATIQGSIEADRIS